MSQHDEPRSPGEEPRTSGPGDQLPPDEGTMIMESGALGGSPAPAATPAPGPVSGYCPNPACRQPVGPDLRFCQACGTALEGERPRPWLILVGLVWLLIAVGAYAVLYSSAFVIGRP